MIASVSFFTLMFLCVSSTPLLLWSKSGDVPSSLYSEYPMGSRLSRDEFVGKVITPYCDKYNFVVVDVVGLTYQDMVELAESDSSQWPFLKSQLGAATFEKLFAFSGKSNANDGASKNIAELCGNNAHVRQIEFDANSQKASVVVDEQLKGLLSALEEETKGKPTVYILRDIAKSQNNEAVSVKRRSAVDVGADDNGGFIATNCYLFNYKKIEFQPLSGFPSGSKRVIVKDWQDDESPDCSAGDKSIQIKLKATNTDTKNLPDLTDIKLEMTIKTYMFSSNLYYKYWYADSLAVKFTLKKEEYITNLTDGFIAAPMDKSYACQFPDNWPKYYLEQAKSTASANLFFDELQVDVNFIFNGTEIKKRTSFSDGVDCESKLGKGGVLFFFLFAILLLVIIYVAVILSTAQNPVFGDKQIVVAQE